MQQTAAAAPKKKKTGLVIGLSAAGVVIIALALCFIFGWIQIGGTNTSSNYVISVYDEYLNISKIGAFKDYGTAIDVKYVVDGEESYELDIDDFMDDPTTVTIQYVYVDGVFEEITINDLMIINTELEDSIDMDDYEDAKALYVRDPLGEVDMKDISELTKLESLFLNNCSDIDSLKGIEDLKET